MSSSQPNIRQLAAEIVHDIGASVRTLQFFSRNSRPSSLAIGQLNINDAGNLRLTCRRLNEMLEATVLQQITLNIHKANLSRSIPKIRALAAGRSPGAARATTCLLLVCFAPSYDLATQSTMVDEETSEGERRMKKYLFDAIAALKHVSNVRLAPHIFSVYSY